MKQVFKLKKIASTTALAMGVSLTAMADANLVQLAPRELDPFTLVKFDPEVRGQIFAFPYSSPEAYATMDNGKKWRRILNLYDHYAQEGIYHFIKGFKVGPGKDMVCFKANANEPRGEALIILNQRTGDLRNIAMPNKELGSSLQSFDVYGDNAEVQILHTVFSPDGFTPYSQVHYTKDGGKTWKLIYSHWENEFVHPVRVAIAPDNPSRLYIMRSAGPYGVQGGLLISDDEGDNWREVLPGYTLGPIAFNPTNPKEIYLGTWHQAPYETLFHSLDGGDTWEPVDLDYSHFIVDNFTDIVFDPSDPQNIIVAEENQLFVTGDGFASYTDAAWPDLMFPNTVSINPYDSDDVIIGLDAYGLVRSNDRLQTIDSPWGSYQNGDFACRSITIGGSTPYFLRENELRTPEGYLYDDFTAYTKVIGVPSVDDHVLGLDSDGNLVWIDSEAVATQVMKGVTNVSKVVKAGSAEYVVIDGALYTLTAGDKLELTKVSDGIGAIAANGTELVAVFGSDIKKYDGADWTALPTLTQQPSMLSLAADGTVAALAENSIYLLRNGAWTKADTGCGVLSVDLAPANSNFIVARKQLSTNLVSYIYSTDGGATWSERNEEAFELAHADSGLVTFTEDGECKIYLASEDMGALAYTLDPDFVAEEPVAPEYKVTEVRNLTAAINPDGSCNLTWISPEGHYVATYDVLRDGTVLASGIKEREYTDASISTGKHEWTVVAHYDKTTTEGVSVEKTYDASIAPVTNLVAEQDNLLNGDAVVSLTWTTPAGYDNGNYNLYRDGELIAQGITASNYSERQLSAGNHLWAVSAVYNGVESEKADVTLTVVNNCAPVRDLDAWFDLDTKEVNLSWDAPGDLPKGWLSVCDEPAGAYKPIKEDSFVFGVATFWTAEELERYGLVGAKLTDMAFVPGSERAGYSPRVYLGGDNENPGAELGFKNFAGAQLAVGEWNTWTLPSPVEIVEGKGIWVGYIVSYATTVDPVGVDAAPLVAGRNKISPNAWGWMNLEDYDRHAHFNFCLGARFEMPDGTRFELRSVEPQNADDKISYEVYRDGELISTTNDTFFTEGDLDEQYYTYDVKAIHSVKGEAPAMSTTLFGGNLCPAPTDIKLETDKGAVVLNWTSSAPQLVPETIFSENFDAGSEIPTGWTLADKDGDSHNWEITSYEPGTGFMASYLFYYEENGPVLASPDNWAITPRITVDGVNAKLVYNISSPGTYQNNTGYEVLVSTTGTDYDDFKVVDRGVLTNTENTWFKKVVDLSEYSGDIYIAFRHINKSDDSTMGLYLDNIEVTQEVGKDRLYNVYRNGQLVGSEVAGNTFTDNTVTDGNHVWTVTAICDEYLCESNPLSIEATISNSGVTDAVVTENSIYYNPATEVIAVYAPEYAETEVTVWNVAGQLVARGETDNTGRTAVAANNLGAGVYLVRVGSLSSKLIIK